MNNAKRDDKVKALKLEYGRLAAKKARGANVQTTKRMQEIRNELQLSHEQIVAELPSLTLPK